MSSVSFARCGQKIQMPKVTKSFILQVCRKQLSTGEELYILDRDKFLCKDDYYNLKNNQGA